MTDQPAPSPAPPPAGIRPPERGLLRRFRGFFGLRKEIATWEGAIWALVCVLLCLGVWWFVTRGEEEDRLVSSYALPNPHETFASFRSLWFDQELTRNTFTSLRRVVLGFGLGALVGIPLGVLCGCFPRIHAFFNPLSLFGRNIPIAALIPLMGAIFGNVGELNKVIFLFVACVMFILSDTARAVAEVSSAYVDTAYTLGASRRQVILKVLVPLAMPSIFNSLRLLFGLAFGYIMLAEVVVPPGKAGGIGHIINISQRVRSLESSGHIILIILVIPVIALAVDRILFWIQKELFPYRYGGTGILNQALTAVLHAWDDFKTWLRRRPAPAAPEQGKP